MNKGLETYLRCFAGEQPRRWAHWLAWAEYSYNTSPHMSTTMTPFKIVYGREPPKLLRIGEGQTPVDSVEELLQERDFVLDELKLHILRAQQIMKHNSDSKRREVSFNVGNQVFLKLQPYNHTDNALWLKGLMKSWRLVSMGHT